MNFVVKVNSYIHLARKGAVLDVQITVDGSCTRRKRMSVGCVVRELRTDKLLEASYLDLAPRGTNNVAEYRAIINACVRARAYAPGRVVIYTDSQLALRQLQGEYRVNDKRLRVEYETARESLKRLGALLRWHRRDKGDGPQADELANRSKREEANCGNEAHADNGSGGAGPDANRHSPAPGTQVGGHRQTDQVEVST